LVGQCQCRTQVFAVVLLTLCMGFTPAAGQKSGDAQKYEREIRVKASSIDSIKTELAKGRKRLAELKTKEGDVQDKIQQLESNISLAQRYLSKLDTRIADVAASIDSLNRCLDTTRTALHARQEKMKQRMRNMYMTRGDQAFDILFNSGSLSNALTRVRYFQGLMAYDTTLLHSIDSTRKIQENQSRELETQRLSYEDLKQSKQKEEKTLVADRESHAVMLGQVQDEKKANQAMIQDLETAQKQLEIIIKQLEKKKAAAIAKAKEKEKAAAESATAAAGFARLKGRLPWPVSGTVIKDYGKIVHPVYKTITMNPGIDISAKPGATVSVVAQGNVVYIGSMRGLGNFVVVDHGGDYLTIYSHLDKVAVAVDNPIKRSGIVGTAARDREGSQAMVHFEIRKSTESLNPMDWLVEE
jgi:septal ring factor EnvC (AmiA/AmiB activator)